MAQSHVFQSPGVDWAGQVTVFDSAGLTATANASDIVKPSNWNSAHNEYLTLTGNTAGASTMSGTNIVMQGGNNITLSANGATLVISAGAGGGGMGISAGTQSVSTGTMIFADSNGMAFGMSGSSQITASYTQSTHSHATAAFSGSNGSFTANTVTFGALNGLTFYTSNGSMVGSHNALTSQSNQAFSADASSTFQTLTFQDSNGVSFSNNAGALRVTHALQFTSNTSAITSNALHSSASRVINIVAATNNTGGGTASLSSNVSFSAANGITFYTSAGNAIVGSHNALTTARASTDAVGLGTAQTNVTWTVNSAGISLNAGGYAGTTTAITGGAAITMNSAGFQFNGTGLAGTGTTFNGANISGSITQNTAGLNLSLSVAGPGAAAITQTMGISNITAGGSTAGTTGGVTGDDIQFIFVPGSNITMSQSINGSSGTLSIYGPAAGGGMTHSGFNPYADFEKQAGQYGQGNLQFDPMRVPNFVMDRVIIPLINTNSSNSSGSHTLSFWVGIYSRNASTLSLVQSVSSSTALTHSGTAGSYSLYSGNRLFTIPLTTTITEGDYWLGFLSRTTSGGTNGSYSNLIMSNIASNFLGFFGSAHNTTQQLTLGQGLYTATTSGMPGSVGFSQIRGSDSAARRGVFIMFANSTV